MTEIRDCTEDLTLLTTEDLTLLTHVSQLPHTHPPSTEDLTLLTHILPARKTWHFSQLPRHSSHIPETPERTHTPETGDMSSVEEVPFKIPLGALGEVKEEVEPVSAPDITVPDYLTVLQETEYAFRLENWVLTGLQGGYPTQPQAQVPRSPSDVLPTCPPYWMMFSSPQESRLASRWSSDLWEPNPLRRCRSLNASHLRNIDGRVHFTISDSDNEEEEDNSGGDVGVTGTRCQGGDLKNGAGSSQRFLDLPGKPVCTGTVGSI
ncbi:hypothetical protein AALO_G00269150 [Alosa alosa]|uniref:Uncharacterized protein n=1 Tax=Alosa alosa TaxID=278164 RepID=A0AAV6FQ06_9TELE|nr:hypothetical protein AALO_G00269150 [Alosa alosa]